MSHSFQTKSEPEGSLTQTKNAAFLKIDFSQNVAIAHPGLNGTNAFPIFFAGL